MRNLQRYLSGEQDKELREQLCALLAREQKIGDVSAGKGRTAGVAISQQVETMLGSAVFQEIDPDKAVRLRRRQLVIRIGRRRRRSWLRAHLFRAAKTIAKENAGFADFYQKY